MVRGFENLRIADASVIPEIVCANTNAPAMMIGWRVADMVRGPVARSEALRIPLGGDGLLRGRGGT